MTEKITEESKTKVLQEIKKRRASLTKIKAMLHLLPDGYPYWLGFFGEICVDIPMSEETISAFSKDVTALGWKLVDGSEHRDTPYITQDWEHEDCSVRLIAYVRATMEGSTCAVLSKMVKQKVFYSEKECVNV